MASVLLHVCCCPCLLGVIDEFSSSYEKIGVFFFNPNIQPEQEYIKRRNEVEKFCRNLEIELIAPQYDPEPHLGIQAVFRSRRCYHCYRLRLSRAAWEANRRRYSSFSTTLVLSPYQDHDMIKKAAGEAARTYGVRFDYRDLRRNYRKSVERSREAQIYRQKYCGCFLSLQEAQSRGRPRS